MEELVLILVTGIIAIQAADPVKQSFCSVFAFEGYNSVASDSGNP